MEVRTIFLVLFVVNLFMGLFTYVIRITKKTFSGINFWIISNFLIGTGYLFIFKRDIWSDFITIIIAQFFFILASIIRIYGLHKFFDLKITKKLNIFGILTILIYTLNFLYFTYSQNNIYLRTLVAGTFMSAVSIITGMIILKNRKKNNNSLYFLIASTYFLFSLIFIIRLLFWVLFPSVRQLFGSDLVNIIQFLASVIIDIAWTTMFFVLHNQKLTHQLADSEEKFRAIFEQAGIGVALLKTETGEFVRINQKYCDFVGYSETELLNKTFKDITYHEDVEENVSKTMQLTKGTNREFTFEKRYVRSDGNLVWGNLTISPLWKHDEKPETYYHIAIVENITEKKQAIESLRETNEYLENLINSANSPIVVWNSELKITRFNHAFEQLSGYRSAEVIGERIEILFPEIQIDYSLQLISKTATGENWETVEINILRNDNEIRTVLWNSANIYNKNHVKIIATIAQGQDITERKKAELQIQLKNQELQELNETKNKFFSILAHDLRNPFNTILGMSDLLIQHFNSYDSTRIEQKINSINKISRQTYNLLEEILLWAKSQSGKMIIEHKYISFLKACEDVINTLKINADTKKIKLSCFEEVETYLYTDENMFKTILRNLITNSIKYTQENGEIKIFAEKENGKTIITVLDTGVGINKNDFHKLWKITSHFSTEGTAKEKGSGFGLILCKEFVEKLGGQIWVESEIGVGSEFKFTIPEII